MLIDRVVDDFPHQVVQTRAVVHVADVHARPFADGLESFENGDVLGPVAAGLGGFGQRADNRGVGHSKCSRCRSRSLRFASFFRFDPPKGVTGEVNHPWLGTVEEGSIAPVSDAEIVAFFDSFRKDIGPPNTRGFVGWNGLFGGALVARVRTLPREGKQPPIEPRNRVVLRTRPWR